MHEISSGERTAVVSIVWPLPIDTFDVTKGSYIACMYDDDIWFGIVEDIYEEFGDFFKVHAS